MPFASSKAKPALNKTKTTEAKAKAVRTKSVVTKLADKLTPAHLAIAEATLNGATAKEAAAIAGCTPATAASVVKKSSDVREYLDIHRQELSSATQIKRGDVVAGLMEAVELAKLSADPGSMIRGWSEIGKMLGLYAPEKKEVIVTAGQRQIASKFEIMTDEELLLLVEQGNVINGECRTVQ